MPTTKKRRRERVEIRRDDSGRPVYKWASGHTKKELEASVKKIKEQYCGIPDSVNRTACVQDFVQTWYRLYKEPYISAATKNMYESLIHHHLIPAFLDKQVRAVSADDLQIFLNARASSWSMVNKLFMLIRQVFRAALSKGVIDRDPSVLLKKPDAPAGTLRELTDEETRAALHVGKHNEEGLLLLLLYYTGMRKGEALGLMWQDIDWAHDTISVERDLDFKSKAPVNRIPGDMSYRIGDVKTAAAVRSVPLPAELKQVLYPRRGLGFIIKAPNGSALSERTFQRRWHRLMAAMLTASDGKIESCEVPDEKVEPHQAALRQTKKPRIVKDRPRMSILTPHYFRHNYASLLYDAGVDVLTAQKWLGHNDITTTLGIYSHLKGKREKASVALLGTAFSLPVAR
jgi:integrase